MASPEPASCPVCDGRSVAREEYAYLLGLYLGDGCLSRNGASSWKLRIVQDKRYPQLIERCARAMEAVSLHRRARFAVRPSWVEVHSTWRHWLCLFPQHGVGKKHLRRIELSAWQAEVIEGHWDRLVEGLLHSDGGRHVNRVIRRLTYGDKVYEYPRYQFTNRSDDIKSILTRSLDVLGIPWTAAGSKTISIARRDAVAALDRFVEPKH